MRRCVGGVPSLSSALYAPFLTIAGAFYPGSFDGLEHTLELDKILYLLL
jgi:hypothetical protein